MSNTKIKKQIRKLVGLKFKDIFYQPTKDLISDTNMCVINFGDDINYSLHIFSFVRITQRDTLLLTASDEFFDKEYERLDNPDESFVDSLLSINLLKVKEILKDSILIKIKVSKFDDLELIFDNEVKIEVSIDCMYNNFEYYRFIEFVPDFENNIKSIHYIVKFKNKKIVCEKHF